MSEPDTTQPDTSGVPADIPELDIPQPNNSGALANIPELDIPQLNNSGSVPGLDAHINYPDNQDTPSELLDIVATIELPQLQMAQQYIDLLCTADLENSGMQPDEIDDLRNLGQDYNLVDCSPLLRSLRHFINNVSASWKHYEQLRAIECMHRPNNPILSFDQVKRCVCWLSGVVPVEYDMCTNSCLAFTGPQESLDACSHCNEPRYCSGTTKPWKWFTTIPIGPVLQVMYSSQEIASCMHYLERKLAENVEHARPNEGILDTYDDTASG